MRELFFVCFFFLGFGLMVTPLLFKESRPGADLNMLTDAENALFETMIPATIYALNEHSVVIESPDQTLLVIERDAVTHLLIVDTEKLKEKDGTLISLKDSFGFADIGMLDSIAVGTEVRVLVLENQTTKSRSVSINVL